jgi:hypothetical protein
MAFGANSHGRTRQRARVEECAPKTAVEHRAMRNHAPCALLFALAIGCGGARTSDVAEVPPANPSPGETAPVASVAADEPSGPRITGEWLVGGRAFVPEVAIAFANADGTYEVRLATPAIDCEFARNGGNTPADLRQIRVHSLRWEAGVPVQSSGGAIENQVAFDYTDPERGHSNWLANGTVTPGRPPSADSAGTLEISTRDREDSRGNDAQGSVEVALCD